MARVALVTGGTRGIGAAVSTHLQAAGRRVVASYAGNDAAAEAFTRETGIAAVKFDAGDFGACEAALARIAAEHGAVEVLVNNAGITRDGTLSKMTREMWDAVVDTNLGSCFNLCKLTFEGMRAALGGAVLWDQLLWAVALNVVWMAAGIWLFAAQFRQARLRGALLSIGE